MNASWRADSRASSAVQRTHSTSQGKPSPPIAVPRAQKRRWCKGRYHSRILVFHRADRPHSGCHHRSRLHRRYHRVLDGLARCVSLHHRRPPSACRKIARPASTRRGQSGVTVDTRRSGERTNQSENKEEQTIEHQHVTGAHAIGRSCGEFGRSWGVGYSAASGPWAASL